MHIQSCFSAYIRITQCACMAIDAISVCCYYYPCAAGRVAQPEWTSCDNTCGSDLHCLEVDMSPFLKGLPTELVIPLALSDLWRWPCLQTFNPPHHVWGPEPEPQHNCLDLHAPSWSSAWNCTLVWRGLKQLHRPGLARVQEASRRYVHENRQQYQLFVRRGSLYHRAW